MAATRSRSSAKRRSGWLRAGAVGAAGFALGCVSLGVVAGIWWPAADPAPIWHDGAGRPAIRAGRPDTFADVVAAARPGVVTVHARAARPAAEPVAGEPDPDAPAGGPRVGGPLFGEPVFESGTGYRNGSGFVVNGKGLVVTSRHVVTGSDAIEVIVQGRGRYRAAIVGEDKATDIAIVRLEDAPPGLAALPLGESELLRAGDWIVAVGNPYGFAQTVTAGVVSFVGRHLEHSDLAVTNDFLQISAPVNPGSSGCPVLDLQGRVVGVTTQAAAGAQGISFAVPSRTLKWTLAAMEASPDGIVRRGYLGIEFASRTDVDDAGIPCGGAVIVRVVDGAPAQRAGIRSGDVVVEVDGVPIADATTLHERIVRGAPGQRLAVQVLRSGRLHAPIEAVLSEMGGPPDELN